MKLIQIKNSSIYDYIKTIILFFGLLYAFIPFETGGSTLAYKIHMFFLMLITLNALYFNGFKLKINKLGIISIFILVLFLSLSVLRSSGPYGIIMSFSVLFAFITASIIQSNLLYRNHFVIALKWIIIFSITSLFLQFSIFTITGKIIHFHEMLFPFSDARIGFDVKYSNLFRMGGLHIEPGTYSNWTYLFLVTYMVLNKKAFSPLVVLGSISIILSFSVWGMVFGSYLFIILLLSKMKKSSWKIKILVFLTFLGVGYGYINYFVNSDAVNFAIYKLDSGNESTESKKMFYNKFEEKFEEILIIGQGYEPQFNEKIDSPQDSGIILNLSVTYGVLFTLIIIFLYIISFLKCCSLIILLSSLPIFIGKMFYWDPAFWLLYFLIIYGGYSNLKKRRINNEKNIIFKWTSL